MALGFGPIGLDNLSGGPSSATVGDTRVAPTVTVNQSGGSRVPPKAIDFVQITLIVGAGILGFLVLRKSGVL